MTERGGNIVVDSPEPFYDLVESGDMIEALTRLAMDALPKGTRFELRAKVPSPPRVDAGGFVRHNMAIGWFADSGFADASEWETFLEWSPGKWIRDGDHLLIARLVTE